MKFFNLHIMTIMMSDLKHVNSYVHVKSKKILMFFGRVFEMAVDEDARIRSRVLHIICDGSTERLEEKVYETLQKFKYDKDSDIRRTTHKVMRLMKEQENGIFCEK